MTLQPHAQGYTGEATPNCSQGYWWYLIEFLLLEELVLFIHLLPTSVCNVILGKASWQVDTIVEVTTPEYVVMGVNGLPLQWSCDRVVSHVIVM